MSTFVVFLMLSGALAMVLRVELINAQNVFMSTNDFNTTMSLHGIMMIAVAVATIVGGFGNYLVPIMNTFWAWGFSLGQAWLPESGSGWASTPGLLSHWWSWVIFSV